jgi:transaldolase
MNKPVIKLTPVEKIYYSFGQSVWLDALSRTMIHSGELATHIAEGVRGVTTNPSIIEKAITSDELYHEQIQELREEGHDAEGIYWRLVRRDIQQAADILRPLYDSTLSRDGYVSVEVSPRFAKDPVKTIEQAQWLWDTIERPNVMIKVPATKEGVAAVLELTARGINTNTTLIFSLKRYLEVMHAYLKGLEHRVEQGKPIDKIHGVGSFFISRFDTLLNPLLATKGGTAKKLINNCALAQAHIAYGMYHETFGDSVRMSALREKGGNIQRILWASTSVKDPSLSPLLYTNNLIAEDSVNTMPLETVEACMSAGTFVSAGINKDRVKHAHAVIDHLKDHGINMKGVTDHLEKDGLVKFEAAFDAVLKAIDSI